MRKSLLLLAALSLLAGCETRIPLRGSVAGDYYDSYYDGYYGAFDVGYWGNDGGRGFNNVHGSGMQRDH